MYGSFRASERRFVHLPSRQFPLSQSIGGPDTGGIHTRSEARRPVVPGQASHRTGAGRGRKQVPQRLDSDARREPRIGSGICTGTSSS